MVETRGYDPTMKIEVRIRRDVIQQYRSIHSKWKNDVRYDGQTHAIVSWIKETTPEPTIIA